MPFEVLEPSRYSIRSLSKILCDVELYSLDSGKVKCALSPLRFVLS
jgi:hypothetical protein